MKEPCTCPRCKTVLGYWGESETEAGEPAAFDPDGNSISYIDLAASYEYAEEHEFDKPGIWQLYDILCLDCYEKLGGRPA